MASIYVGSPSCAVTEGVDRNGKSTAGHQHYLCRQCRTMDTHFHLYNLTAQYTPEENHRYDYKWLWMPCQSTHYRHWSEHHFPSFKKLSPQSVTSRIKAGWGVIVCVKREEQRGYVGWVDSYISIHFLSLNPLLVRRRRYSRGERYPSALCGCHSLMFEGLRKVLYRC